MKKEIVIIGGGVVGLSAAVLLGALNLDVTVLDAKPIIKNTSEALDLRVYAINAASQGLFEKLNIWSLLPSERLSPYRNMYVWDEASKGILSFGAQELGLKALGHIVEEKQLKNALLERIDTFSNITLYDECQLTAFYIS